MTSRLKPGKSLQSESADDSRRSFFWKLGAGVSGAMASVAGVARADAGDAKDLSLRVAMLEEERTLRRLHDSFEQALDRGQYEKAIGYFADDAQVVFNSGVFDNRSGGVSRLYGGLFKSGKTGKRMEPAPGFELGSDQLQDKVEVSPDRLSATAIFPYSIQVGAPIESEASIASMARLQGDGVETWWEGGEYHVTYKRDAADQRWRISRLEYRTLSRASYRSGRSHATAIAVPAMSALYPEDPQGPDALV